MRKKFTGANPSYTSWSNIDQAILNCTPPNDFGERYATPGDVKCWGILSCALSAADPTQQAELSSASTILGLLPTVLAIMATSVDDLVQIHSRFPILAFFLSLSNPSSISTTLSSAKKEYKPTSTMRSPGLLSFLSTGISIPFTNKNISIALWIHDLILHLLASGCVALMFYHTLILGLRGVVVYACWTWHNPLTWVSVGGLVHLLRIFSYRLCLGPMTTNDSNSNPNYTWWSRWHYSLASSNTKMIVKFPKMERFLTLCFQIIGLMNYGYGTVMLSSITLVNPVTALEVFTLLGFSAVMGRLIAIWLLEVYPDVSIHDDGDYKMLDGNELTIVSLKR